MGLKSIYDRLIFFALDIFLSTHWAQWKQITLLQTATLLRVTQSRLMSPILFQFQENKQLLTSCNHVWNDLVVLSVFLTMNNTIVMTRMWRHIYNNNKQHGQTKRTKCYSVCVWVSLDLLRSNTNLFVWTSWPLIIIICVWFWVCINGIVIFIVSGC